MTIKEIPGYGPVRREGLAYALVDAASMEDVNALFHETWCHRLHVRQGEFQAMCEIDGEPFVLVGRIGGDV